jgi:hypothetical protein
LSGAVTAVVAVSSGPACRCGNFFPWHVCGVGC